MGRVLFMPNTFEPTPRLEMLRAGTKRLTTDDVIELWQVYSEAEGYTGHPPTLVDFGYWLRGSSDSFPAEVTW
jgi:hypothetical protein